MIKKIFNILFASLVVASLFSCNEQEDIELNQNPDFVVVFAELAQGETAEVELRYSTDFALPIDNYEDKFKKQISNARVILKASNGKEEILKESKEKAGIYYSELIKGEEDVHYDLIIDAAGKRFTSSSYIPKPVKLDKIEVVEDLGNGEYSSDGKAEVTVYWKDRPNERNFYMLKLDIDSENLIEYGKKDNIYLFSDINNDGNNIKLKLKKSSLMKMPDYAYTVSLRCIDEDTYNYISSVQNYEDNGSDFTFTSPGNLPTNINGGAVGFFNAFAVSKIVWKK
ncbi:MAG: DUF4249 domain-containing protein [Bacteroidales bacterium]